MSLNEKSMLYLFFDAEKFRLEQEYIKLTNRIMYDSKHTVMYDDIYRLLSIKTKIDFLYYLEKEIYKLLN